MTDKTTHLTPMFDVLSMMGKMAGGLANMSVGLRQAKHDDTSSLDLYYNGSAEQGVALVYFRWPFPLAKSEGVTGQTKLSLKGDFSAKQCVPAWLLANALPPSDNSVVTRFEINPEERTLNVTHKRAASTLPLIPALPGVTDDKIEDKNKTIDLGVLSNVLSAFPPRFTLVAPISTDKALSDLYVSKHGTGVIAGFATTTTAVFAYLPKQPTGLTDATSYDMDAVNFLRALPSIDLVQAVSMGRRSVSIRGTTMPEGEGMVWRAKMRLRLVENALSPLAVMGVAAKLFGPKPSAHVKGRTQVKVHALMDVVKRAIGFSPDTTDIKLSGEGRSLVVTVGKESRSRSRMMVDIGGEASGSGVISPISLTAAALKHVLGVFDSDGTITLSMAQDNKAVLIGQDLPNGQVLLALIRGLGV